MRRLKKYSSGEGAQFISRRQALKKLQLSLNEFRRLCIIKGVYPREPKNRRKAQKGKGDIKILYHSKDIRFLLHEPIVWTLRSYKIFSRKTGRDRAIRDFRNLKRRLQNAPELKIDHIVKERYPSFIDAIKDLDDCLTLLFLFSTFPSIIAIPREQSALCRRLTIEFMHAVIAGKMLRKVFISIKGYYFQAEIKGEKVTWIVPHYYPFAPQKKTEVDFKLMSIFVEFYTIMLGFVNFRLYHSLNLVYPPVFNAALTETDSAKLLDEQTFVSERIAALNIDLIRTDSTVAEEEEQEIDIELLTNEGDSAKINKMKEDLKNVQNLKTLFKGMKIFINREVPREPLVFIIRCCGGQVSWDKTLFVGATFNETDETITHQIVDRPVIDKKYISRDYVQPQWIFDCVNQMKLLPTNKYFIGVDLPPHLSPFYDYEEIDESEISEMKKSKALETANDLDYQLERAFNEEQAEEIDEENKNKKEDIQKSDDDEDEKDVVNKDVVAKEKKKKMKVVVGKIQKPDKANDTFHEKQEANLKAKMVKGKHRYLYSKLLTKKKGAEKEQKILMKKRQAIAEDKFRNKKQKV